MQRPLIKAERHAVPAPRQIRTRTLPRCGLALGEFGFGGASVGNLYNAISDSQAADAIAAALECDVRYFDTAPYYGFGLSERRIGAALRTHEQEVILSTKVGRLLDSAPTVRDDRERHGFRSAMPFAPRYDYSYDGVMRSFEASLDRLGLARIDILYVHDIGEATHGPLHEAMFGELTHGGGFRALEALRSGGAISAFGLGVNEWQVCMEAMEHADLDVILLAGRYTLLEQDEALTILFPQCLKREVGVVVGGPFNSGILATGTATPAPHYNYQPAPQSVMAKVERIEAVCSRHSVTLAAAALRFPIAHPAVVSVIAGLASAARVHSMSDLLAADISDDFWAELREAKLIADDAPIPRAACP